ncbi:MAG: ferritin family protein [Pseudomonadota bacterium]|nr:ferritin family protein [Pseudomonadota bacterium]
MSFGSFEEVVTYAIEKEKEAAAFYDEISSQEKFSGAKELFAGFADEERKHQKMLEGILSDKGKISEYKFEWIPDLKRSNYLVDMEYEKGMHYKDILRIAMKREEKALKFYNDVASENKNEEQVKMFKILAQEEAKHKLGLEKLYDNFMAEQGD